MKQYALLIALLGGIAIAVVCALAGYKAGHAVASLDAAQAHITELDHIVTVQRVVIREVPKIVERVVTKEVTVEKEVERVITVANSMLAPDCVMPHNFGLLLRSAAEGIDPASARADELAGTYDCRETLTAVLTDLRAGWRNSARLEGLQEYERLMTSSSTPTNGGAP